MEQTISNPAPESVIESAVTRKVAVTVPTSLLPKLCFGLIATLSHRDGRELTLRLNQSATKFGVRSIGGKLLPGLEKIFVPLSDITRAVIPAQHSVRECANGAPALYEGPQMQAAFSAEAIEGAKAIRDRKQVWERCGGFIPCQFVPAVQLAIDEGLAIDADPHWAMSDDCHARPKAQLTDIGKAAVGA